MIRMDENGQSKTRKVAINKRVTEYTPAGCMLYLMALTALIIGLKIGKIAFLICIPIVLLFIFLGIYLSSTFFCTNCMKKNSGPWVRRCAGCGAILTRHHSGR